MIETTWEGTFELVRREKAGGEYSEVNRLLSLRLADSMAACLQLSDGTGQVTTKLCKGSRDHLPEKNAWGEF